MFKNQCTVTVNSYLIHIPLSEFDISNDFTKWNEINLIEI